MLHCSCATMSLDPQDQEYNVHATVKDILHTQKPQLLAEWNKMNGTGFEPTARVDFQVGLIERLYQRQYTSTSALTQRQYSGTLPEATPFKNPSTATVISDTNKAPDTASLSHQETKKCFARFDQKLTLHTEQLDRDKRSTSIVMYNRQRDLCRLAAKARLRDC